MPSWSLEYDGLFLSPDSSIDTGLIFISPSTDTIFVGCCSCKAHNSAMVEVMVLEALKHGKPSDGSTMQIHYIDGSQETPPWFLCGIIAVKLLMNTMQISCFTYIPRACPFGKTSWLSIFL